jgi:hypothetical protein
MKTTTGGILTFVSNFLLIIFLYFELNQIASNNGKVTTSNKYRDLVSGNDLMTVTNDAMDFAVVPILKSPLASSNINLD